MNNLTNKLENINACHEAVEWIKSFSSYEEAWSKCDRGDWMLWIASKAGIGLRTLTKAKVECAKLAEHLMTDERSIEALRIAERFADGMATRVELEEVAHAAHDAAYASAYAAANAYITYADDYPNAYASAYKETLDKCANICRQYLDFSKIGAFLESIND